uniref:Uncharacterized protein n=1 Tax=Bubo bubo TaxID=30461 RepID=A0A8C0EB94_BUBBB
SKFQLAAWSSLLTHLQFLLWIFVLNYVKTSLIRDFNIPYNWDSMPPWYCTLLKTSRLSKMDTWIYFMHRLMHHKSFYLYSHKLHHEYACLAATICYAFPVYSLGGYIITGAGIFTAIHIFCKHLLMVRVWFTALILKTMDTRR